MEGIRTTITPISGLWAVWEYGAKIGKDFGSACVICDADGAPKKQVHLKSDTEIALDGHALFVVAIGDYTILSSYEGKREKYVVYEVVGIDHEFGPVLRRNNSYNGKRWWRKFDKKLSDAKSVVKAKMYCYQCSDVRYALPD